MGCSISEVGRDDLQAFAEEWKVQNIRGRQTLARKLRNNRAWGCLANSLPEPLLFTMFNLKEAKEAS